MAVAKGVAFFVADSFQELVNPDRGIDSEALAVEGCQVGWACGGGEDCPEGLDAHCCGWIAVALFKEIHRRDG